MLSLHGNVHTSGITAGPAVLKQIVRGGNFDKQDKAKIVKAIAKVEKEEEKAKKCPALDLRKNDRTVTNNALALVLASATLAALALALG